MNVINITIPAGQSKVINLLQRNWKTPVNIVALSTGGSVGVEFSSTSTAISNPATATWIGANITSSSTGDEITRYAPCVAVRLSAVTQPGYFELVL